MLVYWEYFSTFVPKSPNSIELPQTAELLYVSFSPHMTLNVLEVSGNVLA